MQTVGSTNIRYPALVAGHLANGSAVYATILTYPFKAEGEGLPADEQPNILAYASDVVNPLVLSAFTIRQAALSNSTLTSKLTRFTAAMYGANLYLNELANKGCSLSAIAKQLNVTTDIALLEYNVATNTTSGEISPGANFTVNQEALMNIIDVRQEFGGFASVPAGFDFNGAITPGPGKLIDYSIRDAAVTLYEKSSLLLSC